MSMMQGDRPCSWVVEVAARCAYLARCARAPLLLDTDVPSRLDRPARAATAEITNGRRRQRRYGATRRRRETRGHLRRGPPHFGV